MSTAVRGSAGLPAESGGKGYLRRNAVCPCPAALEVRENTRPSVADMHGEALFGVPSGRKGLSMNGAAVLFFMEEKV